MLNRKHAILLCRLAAILLLLGTVAAACARVEGPDVFPPEIDAGTPEDSTEPTATPTLGPINRSGNGISTRTPLVTPSASPTFGMWDPDASAAPAAYAAPGYGYGTVGALVAEVP